MKVLLVMIVFLVLVRVCDCLPYYCVFSCACVSVWSMSLFVFAGFAGLSQEGLAQQCVIFYV